jgi:hypothetical protein
LDGASNPVLEARQAQYLITDDDMRGVRGTSLSHSRTYPNAARVLDTALMAALSNLEMRALGQQVKTILGKKASRWSIEFTTNNVMVDL